MGYREIINGRFEALYGLNSDKFNNLPESNPKSQSVGKGGALWKKAGNGYVFMPVTLGGVELWNPIMRMTARKTIVETPMVERSGAVTEIISIDDYVINIRGIIKNTDGLWPDKEVSKLFELFKRNEAIPITSAMTAIALNGNEDVVITNMNIPEQQGFTESVVYEIECKSDIRFVLELE